MSKNIIVHRLFPDKTIFEIVPLKMKRTWMSRSRKSFAYRCLPLNIANSYGWAVLSPTDFSIVWWGGTDPKDVDIIIHDDEFKDQILSYFGESVFTLHPDFILQTPENYSTYIRGIPNEGRPGVKYLDAIVETDWLPFTFTYNFQMVTPGVYDFKKGEPLFSFFPIERNSVETFAIEEKYIGETEEMFNDFKKFSDHAKERTHDDYYHRLYFQGKGPDNKIFKIKNHITKLIFGGKSDKIE